MEFEVSVRAEAPWALGTKRDRGETQPPGSPAGRDAPAQSAALL